MGGTLNNMLDHVDAESGGQSVGRLWVAWRDTLPGNEFGV